MQDVNLRYFLSVARSGSLSAAAEELRVAISAVSRQITNLESRLNLQLFNRHPRGMELTEAGELLLAYALRNQVEIDNVIAEMRNITTLQRHTVKLACPEGMAWHFLPSVMIDFKALHPSTRFDLQVVDSTRASELVKEGTVDIALTFSLAPMIGVEVVASYDAPICALMSVHHTLAKREALRVSDLQDYPLAMTLNGSTMRYLFDISCNLSGIRITPEFSCDSIGAIYTMISQSQEMIALCGAVSVSGRASNDGLVLIPMCEPQLRQRSLQVQVMGGRNFPQIIHEFLEFLEERLQLV